MEFLQSRTKRLDEILRQITEKPDRIRQDHLPTPREEEAAAGRIKGLKWTIFGLYRTVRQGIEQGRFSCVRVADDGDYWDLPAGSGHALLVAMSRKGQ